MSHMQQQITDAEELAHALSGRYSLALIEQALADGRVGVLMQSGRTWQLRRSGATKLWKTRPGEFRIPVKAGLKSCTYITHLSGFGDGKEFSIQPNRKA